MNIQYNSPLLKIDPRVKLVWVLSTVIPGLVFSKWPPLSIILLSIILVALSGRVFLETIYRLKWLGPTLIIVGLIFGITVHGETIFFLIPPQIPILGGNFAVSKEGLSLGLISTLRIFIFVIPVLVMVITTSNSDLLQALIYFRMRQELALMVMLALNFIPIYINEINRITDAQRVRAHQLIDQGAINKARALIPIFLPLMLSSVERADTLGKTLEMRGISRGLIKVEFQNLEMGSIIILALSVLLIIGTLASMVI